MNVEQLRKTFSPWFDVVTKRFQDSFSEDYDINTLAFLHENIDKEIKFVFSANDRFCTVTRIQALYNVLTHLYEHILWKLRKEDFPNATLSCVKLLSQLIKTGLLLTQDLTKCEYIDRILTALKLFTGKPTLLYDALLLVNGLKKFHYKPYSVILWCVLKTDYKEITDPLLYMEIILLFRRLRAMSGSRNKTLYALSTKIKPPSNLISWLVSLNVNGSISFLKLLKHKKIAQQLMKKNIPESLLKTIRHMILKSYYFEESCNTYRTMTVSEKSPDLFIIDSSSMSVHCSNEIKPIDSSNNFNLKKIKSKKQDKERTEKQKKDSVLDKKNVLSDKRTKKLTSKESNIHVSYINNYSNLVIENEQSESLYESDASSTYVPFNSAAGTSRIVSSNVEEHGKSNKKRRKSKASRNSPTQDKKLRENCAAETTNVSDSDSVLYVTEVPAKKSKKDYLYENIYCPYVSPKRSYSENVDSESSAGSDTANVKHRKKIKYTIDLGSSDKSPRNTESMCIASENEIEKSTKQNSNKSSLVDDEVSLSADVIRNKKDDKLGLLKTKKQKSMKISESSSRNISTTSKKTGNVIQYNLSSTLVGDKNKSHDRQASSFESKISVVQTLNNAENSKVPPNQSSEIIEVTENKEASSKIAKKVRPKNIQESCTNLYVNSGNGTVMTGNRKQSSINSSDEIRKLTEAASHSSILSNDNYSSTMLKAVETFVEKESEDSNSQLFTKNVSTIKSDPAFESVVEKDTEGPAKETNEKDISSTTVELSTQSVVLETSNLKCETAIKDSGRDKGNLLSSETNCQRAESSETVSESSELNNSSYLEEKSIKNSSIEIIGAKSDFTSISTKESKISPECSNINSMYKEISLFSQNNELSENISVLCVSQEKKDKLSMDSSMCSVQQVNDYDKKNSFQSDVCNDKSDCADITAIVESNAEQNLLKYPDEGTEKQGVPSGCDMSSSDNNVKDDVISTMKLDKNQDLSKDNSVPSSISKLVKSNLQYEKVKESVEETNQKNTCSDSGTVFLDVSNLQAKSILDDSALCMDSNKLSTESTNQEAIDAECKSKLDTVDSVKDFPAENFESESKNVSISNVSLVHCSNVDKRMEEISITAINASLSSDAPQNIKKDALKEISLDKDISSICIFSPHSDDLDSKCKDLANLSDKSLNKKIVEGENAKNKIFVEEYMKNSENLGSTCTSMSYVESINAAECSNTKETVQGISICAENAATCRNILQEMVDKITEIHSDPSAVKDISSSAITPEVFSELSEVLESNDNVLGNSSIKNSNEEAAIEIDMKCEISEMDVEKSVKNSCNKNVEFEAKFAQMSNLKTRIHVESFVIDKRAEEKSVLDESVTACLNSLISNISHEKDEVPEKIISTCEESLQEAKDCLKKETEQSMLVKSQNNEKTENLSQNDAQTGDASVDVIAKSACQEDIITDGLSQKGDVTHIVSQDDVVTDSVAQEFIVIDSVSQEDEVIDSVPQEDEVIDSVPQEDEVIDSVSQDVMKDSVSQECVVKDSVLQTLSQKDVVKDSVSQEGGVKDSISQDDIKSENVPQDVAKVESMSQDDTKSNSLLQNDTEVDTRKNEDNITDSKNLSPSPLLIDLKHVPDSKKEAGSDMELEENQNTIKKSLLCNKINPEIKKLNVNDPKKNVECSNEETDANHKEGYISLNEDDISTLRDKTEIKKKLNKNSNSILTTGSSCDIDIPCSNSKDIQYPSPTKDRISKFTSETNSEETGVVNISNDNESETCSVMNESASGSIVSVIKDSPSVTRIKNTEFLKDKLKENEICKQNTEKIPLKSISEALHSDYIPYFCKNKDYVSFSDISLRNKDRNIVVNSGLKNPNPITNFSSAATAEIFCEYRNGILHEDKTDTLSRDDVLSNTHELSDATKSPSVSSNASDEEFDSHQYSSADEDPLMDEAEMLSKECSGNKIPVETTGSSVLLKNDDEDFVSENEAGDRNDSCSHGENINNVDKSTYSVSSSNENECIEESIPDNKEPVEKVLIRQSLRLKNKSENKKGSSEQNSETDISSEMESKSVLEATGDTSCMKSNSKSDNSTCNDFNAPSTQGSSEQSSETDIYSEKESKPVLEATGDTSCRKSISKGDNCTCNDFTAPSTSAAKSVPDIPRSSEKSPSSQKTLSRKNVPVSKSKSKIKPKNFMSASKGYSLRHRKSRQLTDDSSNLGIDLTKLQLDSSPCSKNTRSKSSKDIKFAKLLSSEIDSQKNADASYLTLCTKRETRSSSAKIEQEATQNTPSYNLRNRKLIISPGKLNI